MIEAILMVIIVAINAFTVGFAVGTARRRK